MTRRHNLNLLYALQMLLRTDSVSKAAQLAHVSQPAMSQTLQKLRAHFGDELVVHHNGRSYPTPLAKALRPRIDNLVGQATRLFELSLAFDPATEERTISIAAPDIIEMVLVAKVSRRIAQLAPGIRLLSRRYDQSAADALYAERIDLAIVPERIADDRLPTVPLLDEAVSCMVCADSTTHGTALDETGYLSARHALPHETVDLVHPHDERTRLLLQQRDVALRAEGHASLAAFITGTDLVVTTLSRYAQYCASLMPVRVISAPPCLASVRFVAQCPPHRRDEPLIVWLTHLFAQCAQSI